MTDLKISQFADGSAIQTTDEIAAVRGGVNTKVFAGSAAALDAGLGVGDVIQLEDDGSGNARLPAIDISQGYGLSTVPPDGSYGAITISSGVWNFTDGSYGDIDISSNSFDIVNPALASIKNLTTSADQGIRLTAADTYATYSLTAGGVALSGVAGTANTAPYFSSSNTASLAAVSAGGLALWNVTGTALTIPYFPTLNTAGSLGFIDDDTMATATSTSLSSSESIKAYVDANSGGFSEYVSPPQTITSSGSLTLAHGLGVKPKLIQLWLICQTAEFGFSVGNEIPVNFGHQSSTVANSMALVADASNFNIRYASYVNVFIYVSNTTAGPQGLTNANWKLEIRAWA